MLPWPNVPAGWALSQIIYPLQDLLFFLIFHKRNTARLSPSQNIPGNQLRITRAKQSKIGYPQITQIINDFQRLAGAKLFA